MIKVTEINPIKSHISDPSVIANYLTYEDNWWRTGQWGKKIEMLRKKKLVDTKGFFLSGFFDRVVAYLEDNDYEVDWEYCDMYGEIQQGTPHLEGITFRDDQTHALFRMMESMRGVWQAPTAAGKTIIMCGLISAYIDEVPLIIVHTDDLFKQTVAELERFFSCSIGQIKGKNLDIKDINVGMIQTLNNIHKKEIDFDWDAFSMVIVDECHHVNSLDGSYANVLKKMDAPLRFGFTATLPTTEKGTMSLEGLIGPKIGRTTYEELQEADVLANPTIKIYKVPLDKHLKKMKGGYPAIYDAGIVYSKARNKLIAEKAAEQITNGLTVLIIVEQVEHGEILQDILDETLPGTFRFIHGNTDSLERENEKGLLANKSRKGIIATRVWSEGTNIKTIGCVINAVGGKSSKSSVQRFGRGMRKAEGKDRVLLIDFFDISNEYLIKHSGERICAYMDVGWM